MQETNGTGGLLMANEKRDRLVELLQANPYIDVLYDSQEEWEDAADYLIENGVIVPPCKVGDRVYSIFIADTKDLKVTTDIYGDKITQIKINRGGYHFKCWWGYFHSSDVGKTVFLTKEQAEQKLKEMRGADNG
jgi:hypothetical protein